MSRQARVLQKQGLFNMPSIDMFTNERMNRAFERYREHFGQVREIGLFGLRIDDKTAELFECLVDTALLHNRRLTESELSRMYKDVPPPGDQVTY